MIRVGQPISSEQRGSAWYIAAACRACSYSSHKARLWRLMMLRWAFRLLSAIATLALLVGLAEHRFRRVRRQLISREDEFLPDRPTRPSPLVEAAQCSSSENHGHSGHRL